jgi:DNA-damage-inducible protein D
MKRDVIAKLNADFEKLVYSDPDICNEFWLARELQSVLGYSTWENFTKVIDKAQMACRTSGYNIADHFRDVTKMVSVGSGAERPVDDIALTRYACYLVAQNGDPRKEVIAFAQTYFAVKTRKQEVLEQRLADTERIAARKKLSASEKQLSGIIYERLGDEGSFARIHSKGDQALFGGMTTLGMKDRLQIPHNRPLADFLPAITIKAKDFANEITNFNMIRDDSLKDRAHCNERAHQEQCRRTRSTYQKRNHARGTASRRGYQKNRTSPWDGSKKASEGH